MDKKVNFAVIWRKTIYENDFVCPKCGKALFDKDTKKLTEAFCVEQRDGKQVIVIDKGMTYQRAYCECKEPVALIKIDKDESK